MRSINVEYGNIVEELEQVVSIELYGVGGVLEGDQLLVSAIREGTLNLYTFRDGKLRRLNRGRVDFYAIPPYNSERVVIARDTTPGREQHVLLEIDVHKPGRETSLTGVPMRVISIVDDGERVAFTGSTEGGVGFYLVEDDGKVEKVVDIPGFGAVTDMSGDIAVGHGAFRGGGGFQLFIVDMTSGEITIHEEPRGSSYAPIVKGRKAYFVLEAHDEAYLYQLDLDTRESKEALLPHGDLYDYRPVSFNFLRLGPKGEIIAIARRHGRSAIFIDGMKINAPEGIHTTAFLVDDSVVATYTSLRTPHAIIQVGLDGTVTTILEGKKPEWLDKALGIPRFQWVERGRARVPVYVLESGRSKKPGPTVVLVHGGPFSEDMDAWNMIVAALASRGFHVVMPNYRGSTGYGDHWRRLIVGDPCGEEVEDVAAAAEWAKSEGLASDLYIMGYSYGGYLTLCSLIRKPGLYKASVAGASVVDWEEMYELSDAVFRSFIDLLFAGDKSKLAERSPISHVDKIDDPLCIIHPQNDTRTPLKPIIRFMDMLHDKGKRFEAHIVPDMGHTINSVEDAIKILLPAILFLARIQAGVEDAS